MTQKFSGTEKWLRGAGGYMFVLLLLVAGASWVWFTRADLNTTTTTQAVAPHTNFRAPTFAMSALTGETYSLDALRGKIVVLNFWATWCPPCRGEMPALDAVYQANENPDVVILGANQMENADTVQAFAQEFQLAFPIVRDADGTVSAQYQVSALPTTFFIDRQGIIRNVVIGGSMTREFIQNQVNALLEERAP